MSFWGVQIKPGKPITHSCENARGRLRISQATLGIGDATKTILVQCNVGNRIPVMICALLPGVTESSQLDLEFAEADDVVFSVIGPRTVYLTGYYVAESRPHSVPQSDSESYGVDIQNSHSEESGCHSEDDDEYEDSFIDDGKLEVFPDSSNNSVDDTDPDSDKPKKKNGRRRQLRKKYQIVESDSDGNTPENEDDDKYPLSFLKNKKDTLKATEADASKAGDEANSNSVRRDKSRLAIGPQVGNDKANRERESNQVKVKDEADFSNDKVMTDANAPENEDGDKFLFSLLKNNIKTKQADAVVAAKAGDEANSNSVRRDKSKLAVGPQVGNDKANREGESNQVKNKEESDFSNGEVITDANAPEKEDGDIFLFSLLKNKKYTIKTKQADAVEAAKAGDEANSNSLRRDKSKVAAVPQVGIGKANREGESNQVKNREEAVPSNGKFLTDDNGNENNAEAKATNHDIPTDDMSMQTDAICGKHKRKREERSETEEKTCEVNIDDDQTKLKSGQKSKKIKKGQKVEDTCTVPTDDKPLQDLKHNESNIKDLLKASSAEEQHTDKEPEKKTRKKSKKKKTQEESKATNELTNKRTLSNGSSVEVLANGPPDGKVAAPGKKVKLYYTAMIKETGHILDSNVGKTPLKCRLGDQESVDRWHIGIDGMRVGEKRRLVIPPSMGFRNHEENVPPESLLVYDVELVSVRK